MKRTIFAVCCAALVIAFCGCGADKGDNTEESSDRVSVIVDDDNLIYQIDGTQEISEVGGKIVERSTDEPEVSSPDGSITLEKAKETVDSCSFEQFYLPSEITKYQKYYYGTVKLNNKDYYSMCFYLEKNSVRMYVGTDFYVSCDGGEVLRCDWSGNLVDCEIGGNSGDKTAEELYSGAKITPEDALFALNGTESAKLGLTEKLSSYTYEIDAKLYTKRGIKCYCVTPKLKYENGIKILSPIYVTADGTGRLLMYNEQTSDYEQVN